jgi:hypothetical protein
VLASWERRRWSRRWVRRVHSRAQPGRGQECKAWGTAGDGDGGAARTAGVGIDLPLLPVERSPWLTCMGVSGARLVWVCLVWLAFVCV